MRLSSLLLAAPLLGAVQVRLRVLSESGVAWRLARRRPCRRPRDPLRIGRLGFSLTPRLCTSTLRPTRSGVSSRSFRPTPLLRVRRPSVGVGWRSHALTKVELSFRLPPQLLCDIADARPLQGLCMARGLEHLEAGPGPWYPD